MAKKGTYSVVVQVYLDCEVEASSVAEAKEKANAIKLPENYRDGSFEIVEVVAPNGRIYEEDFA